MTVRADRNSARTPGLAPPAIVVVLCLLVAVWVGPGAPDRAGAAPGGVASPGAADPAATEAAFVTRINQLRSSRGLPALSVHDELTTQSRIWAANMAAKGSIFHSSNLATGVSVDWAKLGENVGKGGDVDSLFTAFVNSPTHLANLVDPVFSHVGVGVVIGGDGLIYTTHRFMAIRQPPPPTTAPPPPPPPSSTAPAPPPATAPSTTAPTTTVPATTTTTTAPAPVTRLGPIERIPELLRAELDAAGDDADGDGIGR